MPIKESVTIDEVLEVLNRALLKDRQAITTLALHHKVKCNKDLADDETIQVGSHKNGDDEEFTTVGLIGIINGLFGIDDDVHETMYGAIQASIDKESGEIICFSKVDHSKISH